MIIFNIYAIGLAIVLAVVFFILGIFLPPEFVESSMGVLLYTFVGTLVSGIGEIAGLQARLFWLPAWLIGIIALCYQVFTEFGWMSTLGLVALVVGIIAGLLYKMEQSSKTAAPKEFYAFKKLTDPSAVEFWQQLELSFFFPSMLSYTQEICDHNIAVIENLEAKSVVFEGVQELKAAFVSQKMKFSGEKIKIDSDLTAKVTSFIELEIEALTQESEV